MRRYEWTDEQWALVEPLLPPPRGHGRDPGESQAARPPAGPPPRFDPDAYRRRNVIERCIGWLEYARRIAMRYATPR